ncbi:hypothetical protein BMF94_3470 [Rhodotorula taiwanensis]|uniref:Clathrin light chain n=1 Tax=Rhodotorula taiwanensis TaxID=741276 RepID=A0A2S5B9T3_9BASI|nr:hypothetical protein BMF94_3470 [Rhodotorula taiwanensis]
MDDLFGSDSKQAQQDPAGDFLARERAALGADAQSFAAPSDSDAFDKDYEKSAAAFPDLEGSGGADDVVLGDFAGGGNHAATSAVTTGQQVSVTGNDEFAAFEEEYPEIDLPSEQPHENGLNGSSAPEPAPAAFSQPAAASTQSATAPQDSGDSEIIRNWREQQKADIAKREEESARKKEDTIAKARNAIDNYYKDYNSKKEKAIAQNKDDEEAFKTQLSDSLAKGTTWERICTLVDLQDSRSKTTTKSKQDLTRFKELLLSLRREGETAPGAAGY